MAAGRTVAVIDVGSNSVRLLVARQITPAAFAVIDDESFDARLGQGQVDGALNERAIERGRQAMRVMAQVAASHHPDSTIVVGTEALRRATNGTAFIDAVEADTGLRIEVLSGWAEAHASYLGVINSTSLVDGGIIDLGGGSLEFITVRSRDLVDARSAPLGAIYAAQRFLLTDPPTASELEALRAAVREHVPSARVETLVGVGGAIRNLARIVRGKQNYPLRRVHGYILELAEVLALRDTLVATDYEGRRRLPRVSASRAEFLHAAAVVVAETMATVGAERLSVSGQGLREGLVWRELRSADPVIADVRQASLEGLLERLDPGAVSQPVAALAADLFHATLAVHHLDPSALTVLVAAARLAGSGIHIEFYNRDRHAQYIVQNSDLHGFTHREHVLIAALVRWADGGAPDLAGFDLLTGPGDARAAAVLAAILGFARAILRRMPSPVAAVHASIISGALALRIESAAPMDAEALAIERQQRRVEAALGLPLTVDFVPPPT